MKPFVKDKIQHKGRTGFFDRELLSLFLLVFQADFLTSWLPCYKLTNCTRSPGEEGSVQVLPPLPSSVSPVPQTIVFSLRHIIMIAHEFKPPTEACAPDANSSEQNG